jgi:hypothetical protein
VTDIDHLRRDGGRVLEASLRDGGMPTLVLPAVRKAPEPRRTRDGLNVVLCLLVMAIAVGLAGFWISTAGDPAPAEGTPASCLLACPSTTSTRP